MPAVRRVSLAEQLGELPAPVHTELDVDEAQQVVEGPSGETNEGVVSVRAVGREFERAPVPDDAAVPCTGLGDGRR